MRLSEREACFVDAVRKEFCFLAKDFGFVEQELNWDGQGIRLSYRHPKLEVSNYLESEENYSTTVMPLVGGQAPPIFDDEFDEPFTYFELGEAFGTETEPLPQRFVDDRALEDAVRQRAEIVREHIGAWLADSGAIFREIGSQIREARLIRLIPRWQRFVESIQNGFEGGVTEYVAGVNVRGQINSLLKWPVASHGAPSQQLADADEQFERLTVPMKYAAGASKVSPHPRAQRWWRLPEEPKGRLRDYFFRSPLEPDQHL